MRLPIANFQLPISRNDGKPAGLRRGQIGNRPLAIENGRCRVVPEGFNVVPEGFNVVPEGSLRFRRREKTGKSSQIATKCRIRLGFPFRTPHSAFRTAFSLVEILVVVSLLSLIVLALMAVFSTTQRAFRAAVTQTDVLEGSRAAVELMTADLRGLTPSGGVSNGAVNLMVGPTYYSYSPLLQSLPGGTLPRTNQLNYFFLLTRENTRWTGVGYAVNAANASPLFSLYRYSNYTNTTANPWYLFTEFTNQIFNGQWTNSDMSHIMDGVVHLTLRAYDPQGVLMDYFYRQASAPMFEAYPANPPSSYETPFYMFSNTVPAAVELELGVMEDRVLARAESLPFQSLAQSNYLAQQSGAVHVFRQRVSIPNVDPSAYQ